MDTFENNGGIFCTKGTFVQSLSCENLSCEKRSWFCSTSLTELSHTQHFNQ